MPAAAALGAAVDVDKGDQDQSDNAGSKGGKDGKDGEDQHNFTGIHNAILACKMSCMYG